MRWPHDAFTRRDELLVRTRRLTLWIAGCATMASIGLAAALGFALPGHGTSQGAGSAGQAGTGAGQGTGTGSSHGQGGAGQHRKLTPPRHPPAGSAGQPAASSGGS
jgi:hypothetical protein